MAVSIIAFVIGFTVNRPSAIRINRIGDAVAKAQRIGAGGLHRNAQQRCAVLHQPLVGNDPDEIRRLHHERLSANLMAAKAAGVRIGVGSDAYCTGLTPFGRQTLDEVHALAGAGLSEMEAIVAATRSGAEILRIEQLTGDVLTVGEGSLYPALHRLEARDWIESEWRLSEHNRRAKFYQLTGLGRRQLREETRSWGLLVEAVSKVLRTREQPV